jgi:hypothetical protein
VAIKYLVALLMSVLVFVSDTGVSPAETITVKRWVSGNVQTK